MIVMLAMIFIPTVLSRSIWGHRVWGCNHSRKTWTKMIVAEKESATKVSCQSFYGEVFLQTHFIGDSFKLDRANVAGRNLSDSRWWISLWCLKVISVFICKPCKLIRNILCAQNLQPEMWRSFLNCPHCKPFLILFAGKDSLALIALGY